MKAMVLEWSEAMKLVSKKSEGTKLDKETIEKLKSLGYIK